jgi:hypothetical protein
MGVECQRRTAAIDRSLLQGVAETKLGLPGYCSWATR